MEHDIEAEIIFTDKETGHTISQHQMITRPAFLEYGGYAVDHIVKLVKAKRKQ